MQARVTPVHCEVLMLYHYMANLQREMYILTEASITRVDIHLVVVCVLIYLERERERDSPAKGSQIVGQSCPPCREFECVCVHERVSTCITCD